MKEIISIAPGRTCLFGDHQDYLGLPIIACAISLNIKLTATENGGRTLNINTPDINEKRIIHIDDDTTTISKGDHLLYALRVLKRHGCIPNKGYDIEIIGTLPINAGTSSSSAVVVSWVYFLIEAYGVTADVTPEFISQMAYEGEVLEQGAPGGKMDQYSIGLGNIVYVETGDNFSYEIINSPLEGLIIGESGIPKETVGLLSKLREKAWEAIFCVKKEIKDFDIKKAKREDLKKYLNYIPDTLQPYFHAAVINHDITRKALVEFKKEYPDFKKLGALMTEHHNILKNALKITVPTIDAMIEGALGAGALGAKIVGSGGGGSIVALAPQGKEQQIIEGIKNAGGKDAYQVSVDPGARIINTTKKVNV
ncbi:GHMP family kinase ATP-binding protein [Flavivirga jejuensis]|uniref:Galactokinase family protein n=1 Tax=Flavivirga jejuensis TaxID=870487 RepID=A0ABT8WMJ4_9FLAO|nr:galactokinase family protein [Flavivirga jejuensis]MDO5974373.1 galactokinase family protein [Flavivirga jejuensis]